MYVIICDIDNCYTDSREWIKYAPKDISKEPKSLQRVLWDKYQSFSFLAKPNKSVIDFLVAICELIPVYFVTSREDRKSSRADTIRQIEEFSDGRIKIGDTHKLCMRHEFDYRECPIVKEEIVQELIKQGCIPVLAIDDSEENCKMFKRLGIPTKLYNIEKDTLSEYPLKEN